MLKRTTLALISAISLTACGSQTGAGFTPVAAVQTPASFTSVASEGQVLAAINAERAKAGLSPLTYNGQLTRAARAHAQDQAANGYFSHTGKNGSQVTDRVKRVGYSYCLIAENLSVGYPSVQGAVQGWMNSAGHRRNILNGRFTDIGIGIAEGALYVTVFGDPC
ncbi:uncharacterized protein YkwD [Pacificibacter maritimus]|uniref:Uncharacterized protein YkwD n=1 Tax=Pacificibacter maritimus TaxID=762213 RepID=A0A3N4UN69_9RHOB|nr:CAP domain-containing protein [Pacificibacter maritimus]RPE72062.1 uncharacterized protein YkwD [Pacificibacter maritimus]